MHGQSRGDARARGGGDPAKTQVILYVQPHMPGDEGLLFCVPMCFIVTSKDRGGERKKKGGRKAPPPKPKKND